MNTTILRFEFIAIASYIANLFCSLLQVESWISGKVQTASDESYRDPTNLQPKLQKHQAFEAELSANKGRVDSVNQTGEELIDRNHYAAHEIEARIDALKTHWLHLGEK